MSKLVQHEHFSVDCTKLGIHLNLLYVHLCECVCVCVCVCLCVWRVQPCQQVSLSALVSPLLPLPHLYCISTPPSSLIPLLLYPSPSSLLPSPSSPHTVESGHEFHEGGHVTLLPGYPLHLKLNLLKELLQRVQYMHNLRGKRGWGKGRKEEKGEERGERGEERRKGRREGKGGEGGRRGREEREGGGGSRGCGSLLACIPLKSKLVFISCSHAECFHLAVCVCACVCVCVCVCVCGVCVCVCGVCVCVCVWVCEDW